MSPRLSPTRSLFSLLTGAAGLALSNTYRFRLQRERAVLPGLTRPLRAAQLSDLHYGSWIGPGSVRRWVDAALAAEPELILITGDFLDSSTPLRLRSHLLDELARLRAPLGSYAVYGNHDWTSLNTGAARSKFAGQLKDCGIGVINNGGVQVRDDLYLAGSDDWWFGSQDAQAMLAGYRGGATLLLSHNPDYLPYVPAGVTLTLCGHTHGGQVRVPLLGPVKRASLYGTEFLEGWVEAEAVQPGPADASPPLHPPRRVHGYVTHGLGVTSLPLRLNCPAELTVFDFQPGETLGPLREGS